MNFKYLLLFLGASTLFSCDDTLGKIGTSVQPDADKLSLYADTVYFQNAPTTFEVDSFYAVSSNALLGSFNDPNGLYGNLQCDFMTQFKSTSLRFTKIYPDKLDSITLNMTYSSYIGDSLTTMQATVYELTNPLKKEVFSDAKVSDYCDKSVILGRKAYSAYDISGKNPKKTVQVKLSDDFVNRIYSAYKSNNSIFDVDDNSKFLNLFKGIYVTNTFGSGSILSMYGENIRFTFHYKDTTMVKTSKGKDSIVYSNKATSFAATSEVLLVNRYQNSRMEKILTPESNISYIKSPAGVFTKLDFPLTTINTKIGKGTLNGAKLKISTFRVNSNSTTLQPPTTLMLIKKNAINTFFSNKAINLNDSLNNNRVAIATRNKTDGTYTFTNLSAFLNNFLPNQKNGGVLQSNVQFALIPVSVGYDNYGNITSIKHYNLPSGLKFSTAKDKFNLTIFYAK